MLAPPVLLARFVAALATIGYVLLFERAGFTVATVIFMSLSTVSLAPKRPAAIAVALTTSVLFTLFIG